MKLLLGATPYGNREFCKKNNLDISEFHVISSVQSIQGLRFRYEDVVRVPGWQTRDDIEEIEELILRTHIAVTGLQQIRSSEKGVEWDIDANLPMYTRDFLKMINEGKLDDICTYGTATH